MQESRDWKTLGIFFRAARRPVRGFDTALWRHMEHSTIKCFVRQLPIARYFNQKGDSKNVRKPPDSATILKHSHPCVSDQTMKFSPDNSEWTISDGLLRFDGGRRRCLWWEQCRHIGSRGDRDALWSSRVVPLAWYHGRTGSRIGQEMVMAWLPEGDPRRAVLYCHHHLVRDSSTVTASTLPGRSGVFRVC